VIIFYLPDVALGTGKPNRSGDVRTSVIADYDIGAIRSKRSRLPNADKILEKHHKDIRV
jgi:glutaminase